MVSTLTSGLVDDSAVDSAMYNVYINRICTIIGGGGRGG